MSFRAYRAYRPVGTWGGGTVKEKAPEAPPAPPSESVCRGENGCFARQGWPRQRPCRFSSQAEPVVPNFRGCGARTRTVCRLGLGLHQSSHQQPTRLPARGVPSPGSACDDISTFFRSVSMRIM
jgi:hypothetical protein